LEAADDFNSALNTLIRDTIRRHKRIIFNGNGYDEAWIKEATEVRGLLNLKTTPDAMTHFLDEKNIKLFTTHHVYTEAEMRSRHEIMLENYCKTISIEASTMVDMVYKEILPAVTAYTKEICETGIAKKTFYSEADTTYEEMLTMRLSALSHSISLSVTELEAEIHSSYIIEDVEKLSLAIRDRVLSKMQELRAICDEAEYITAEKYWPYPTYSALLYGVQ
ncbi:MAG: glutamine synthetase type III, partial [Clostridia bacterium]|nr:glutamine synthetase type III [Clostridia bacterium]